MKYYYLLLCLLVIYVFPAIGPAFAQEDEPILYFQMEPLDDSLFIHIQQELFIDPPDPKAEIIADIRGIATISVIILLISTVNSTEVFKAL